MVNAAQTTKASSQIEQLKARVENSAHKVTYEEFIKVIDQKIKGLIHPKASDDQKTKYKEGLLETLSSLNKIIGLAVNKQAQLDHAGAGTEAAKKAVLGAFNTEAKILHGLTVDILNDPAIQGFIGKEHLEEFSKNLTELEESAVSKGKTHSPGTYGITANYANIKAVTDVTKEIAKTLEAHAHSNTSMEKQQEMMKLAIQHSKVAAKQSLQEARANGDNSISYASYFQVQLRTTIEQLNQEYNSQSGLPLFDKAFLNDFSNKLSFQANNSLTRELLSNKDYQLNIDALINSAAVTEKAINNAPDKSAVTQAELEIANKFLLEHKESDANIIKQSFEALEQPVQKYLLSSCKVIVKGNQIKVGLAKAGGEGLAAMVLTLMACKAMPFFKFRAFGVLIPLIMAAKTAAKELQLFKPGQGQALLDNLSDDGMAELFRIGKQLASNFTQKATA